MRTLAAILFLLAPPAFGASPIAEVLCEPGARMADRMSARMGATLASTGLRNPEEVVQLWLDDRGDWAMVIAYASGTSCIVAMGESWSDLTPRQPG